MNSSLSTALEGSSAILVALPKNPNLDSVAAGLALYLTLKDSKKVEVYCPEEMRVEFNRLVGVNKIKTEAGNKNLIIKFKDYKATDIERVSYDIENSEFKLTIVPKDDALPPSEEQLVASFAGLSVDTAFLVGGASLADFPIVTDELKDSKVVHFGTTAVAGSGATQIISLARPASSVSESVYSHIKEAQLPLQADVASNLLFGIEEESNSFASSQTTATTFLAMAELMQAGGMRRVSFAAPVDPQPPTQGFTNPFQPQPRQMMPAPQPAPRQPAPKMPSPDADASNPEDVEPQDEWFGPKIYKGTSVS
jgi:hypothetical protein